MQSGLPLLSFTKKDSGTAFGASYGYFQSDPLVPLSKAAQAAEAQTVLNKAGVQANAALAVQAIATASEAVNKTTLFQGALDAVTAKATAANSKADRFATRIKTATADAASAKVDAASAKVDAASAKVDAASAKVAATKFANTLTQLTNSVKSLTLAQQKETRETKATLDSLLVRVNALQRQVEKLDSSES